MAIFMLLQQVPAHQRTNPLLWTGIAVAVTTVALIAVKRRRTLPRSAEAGALITSADGRYPLAYHGHQSGTKGQ
jgi:hypothetical protein